MSTVEADLPAGPVARAAPRKRRRAAAGSASATRSSGCWPPRAASPSPWPCSGSPSSSSTTRGRPSRGLGTERPHHRGLVAEHRRVRRPRGARRARRSRTLVAMVIAVPLALVIALLLVELVHPAVARVVGTGIEMLAAIPSIIFGMVGLFVIVPFIQDKLVAVGAERRRSARLPGIEPGPQFQGGGLSIFTAGVVLAFMVLPFITAVSRDVLMMVPQGHQGGRLRHGLHHLGGHAQDQPALRQQRHRRRRLHRPRPRPGRDDGGRLPHRQPLHRPAALASSTRARRSPRSSRSSSARRRTRSR